MTAILLRSSSASTSLLAFWDRSKGVELVAKRISLRTVERDLARQAAFNLQYATESRQRLESLPSRRYALRGAFHEGRGYVPQADLSSSLLVSSPQVITSNHTTPGTHDDDLRRGLFWRARVRPASDCVDLFCPRDKPLQNDSSRRTWTLAWPSHRHQSRFSMDVTSTFTHIFRCQRAGRQRRKGGAVASEDASLKSASVASGDAVTPMAIR